MSGTLQVLFTKDLIGCTIRLDYVKIADGANPGDPGIVVLP